jgi:hypothetical protein
LIPGLLVISARPDLNLSSFEPRSLVRREPIAVPVGEPSGAEVAARKALTGTQRLAAANVVTADTTITTTVTASGLVPSFEVSGHNAVCGGMIGEVPDDIVEVQEGVETLRVMFEAEQDASLLVVHGEEGSFCADDDEGLLNANPVLDLEAPEPGLYGIFVGRFDHVEPITGTLTITTDPALEPAILAPATDTQE